MPPTEYLPDVVFLCCDCERHSVLDYLWLSVASWNDGAISRVFLGHELVGIFFQAWRNSVDAAGLSPAVLIRRGGSIPSAWTILLHSLHIHELVFFEVKSMLAQLSSFYNKPIVHIFMSYLVVLCMGAGLGAWGYARWQTPPTPIVRTVTNTQYIQVPGPVTYKNVPVIVQDQTNAKILLAQAATDKATISSLTETIAELKNVTVAPPETKTVYVTTPGAPEAHFTDGRLTFDAVGPKTQYALSQKMESQVAAGKDRNGQQVVYSKLFEIWPGETRTELTNYKVVVVSTSPTAKSWFLDPSVQAGFGYDVTFATRTGTSGGLVGLQWFKRGYTKAAEDSVFSLITPVVFIAAKTVKLGVLPVSVNLGRLPHQPFKNLWLSPLVTLHSGGIAITATF